MSAFPAERCGLIPEAGRRPSRAGDPLTRKESGVLGISAAAPGARPVSQEELIDHVWDGSVDSFSNSIRVHISALRKKLRTALGYDPIHNRIGEGYVIEGKENEKTILSVENYADDRALIAGACICLNLLLYRSGATGMDDLGGFVLKYQTENAEVLTIEIPRKK